MFFIIIKLTNKKTNWTASDALNDTAADNVLQIAVEQHVLPDAAVLVMETVLAEHVSSQAAVTTVPLLYE